MAVATSAPPITIEQYLGFVSPPGYRDQLIAGKIIVSPDPKPQHAHLSDQVQKLLSQLLAGTEYLVKQRMNFQMPDSDSMPSPDVFVIERERWRKAVEENNYPTGAPVLAIEVVSRSNRKKEIEQKASLYLQHGTREVWVVYPRKQIVVMHRLRQSMPEQVMLGIEDLHPLPSPLPPKTVALREILDLSFRE